MSNSDVSGDGRWQTGVNYNAFVVQSGSTSSGGTGYATGPAAAYDGSYYAYCETSGPNHPGVGFDLQTEEFSTPISSISFSYLQYGYCNDGANDPHCDSTSTLGTMYVQGSSKG